METEKATSIHILPCNVGSEEAHNLRTPEYLAGLKKAGKPLYYFPELTKNNSSWVNPRYAGKTCAEIFEDLKVLYKEKTGQAPQLKDRVRTNKKTGKQETISGWSPIRSGVVYMKENTTIKDFDRVVEWARENGLDVIRIDLHFDEGTKNRKTGRIERKNCHAHIVFDWVNHETGKTAKLKDDKMSELQDVVAQAVKMKRGKKKTETGAEHIPSSLYREMMAEKNAERLEEANQQAEKELKEKEKKISALSIKGTMKETVEAAGEWAVGLLTGDKKQQQAKIEQQSNELKRAKQQISTLTAENKKNIETITNLQATAEQAQRAYTNIRSVLKECDETGLRLTGEQAGDLAEGKVLKGVDVAADGKKHTLRWMMGVIEIMDDLRNWQSFKRWLQKFFRHTPTQQQLPKKGLGL